MVGRIVTGLGIGALSAVVPLYQSETAPKEIRGSLVATYQVRRLLWSPTRQDADS